MSQKKKNHVQLKKKKNKYHAQPQKIKRKKKGQRTAQKRGKKKKRQLEEAHVHMHMGIFVNQEKIHPYSVFSPFWGENFLVGTERKHLNPTIYFPSSPPNETHFKKVFFPIFSPKFFIHPISPPNKHNHNDESL